MAADTLKTTRVLELYQDFLSEQCAKEGIVRKIEYDKKENGYRLVTQEIEQLSKGEVLTLCKNTSGL